MAVVQRAPFAPFTSTSPRFGSGASYTPSRCVIRTRDDVILGPTSSSQSTSSSSSSSQCQLEQEPLVVPACSAPPPSCIKFVQALGVAAPGVDLQKLLQRAACTAQDGLGLASRVDVARRMRMLLTDILGALLAIDEQTDVLEGACPQMCKECRSWVGQLQQFVQTLQRHLETFLPCSSGDAASEQQRQPESEQAAEARWASFAQAVVQRLTHVVAGFDVTNSDAVAGACGGPESGAKAWQPAAGSKTKLVCTRSRLPYQWYKAKVAL